MIQGDYDAPNRSTTKAMVKFSRNLKRRGPLQILLEQQQQQAYAHVPNDEKQNLMPKSMLRKLGVE